MHISSETSLNNSWRWHSNMNSPCPLDNVRVVLSHPSHPGNIGAAARAMKTMGLESLYLVNPRSFPDKGAETRAAGAWDVLNNTKVCASLDWSFKRYSSRSSGHSPSARSLTWYIWFASGCAKVAWSSWAASSGVGFWNGNVRPHLDGSK